MKTLFFLAFVFLSLSSIASVKISVGVSYSEAVEVFEFLDNLSGTRADSSPEYRANYNKRFPLTDYDKKVMEEYKSIRQKYMIKRSSTSYHGFSANTAQLDPIAFAFFNSKSVDDALKKMQKEVAIDDVKLLAKSIKHFKPGISDFVKESQMFKQMVPRFEKQIRNFKIKQLINKAAHFFNSEGKKFKLTYYLVWWPSDSPPQADIIGTSVIYRVNPLSEIKIDTNLLIERGVQFASSLQPESQKSNLEKIFYSMCPLKNSFRPVDMIEAPLVMALGRISMESIMEKKEFNLYKEWSVNPWINFSSKSIYDSVQGSVRMRKQIFDGVINHLGTTCHELSVLHNFLKS